MWITLLTATHYCELIFSGRFWKFNFIPFWGNWNMSQVRKRHSSVKYWFKVSCWQLFPSFKVNFEKQICIYHSYFNNYEVWGFPKCSGKQRIFLSLKCFLSKEFLWGGKICLWLEMNGVRSDPSVGLGERKGQYEFTFCLYLEFNLHIVWKILFKITLKVSRFKFLTFKYIEYIFRHLLLPRRCWWRHRTW